MCETLQKTRVANTTIKHVCLAHVYIEKQAVESKNELCANSP